MRVLGTEMERNEEEGQGERRKVKRSEKVRMSIWANKIQVPMGIGVVR